MVLKFRAVFWGFLSASKVENLYLLTQMYLQNVVLYAKYWSTARLMPDTEMVLHPSLFTVLCCQTKTWLQGQISQVSENCTAPWHLCEVHAGVWTLLQAWYSPSCVSMQCPFSSALLSGFVVFCPFSPQTARGFVSVMGRVLLCCRAACAAWCFTLKWPWSSLTGTLNSC